MKNKKRNKSAPATLMFYLLACSFSLLIAGNSALASQKPVNPCDLVSESEAESIIGAALKKPRSSFVTETQKNKAWSGYCSFRAPKNKTDVAFNIQNVVPGGKMTHEQWFDQYIGSLEKDGDYKLIPVDNLGTKACWNATMKNLMILEKGLFLEITGTKRGASEEQLFEICKKFGITAVKNIP